MLISVSDGLTNLPLVGAAIRPEWTEEMQLRSFDRRVVERQLAHFVVEQANLIHRPKIKLSLVAAFQIAANKKKASAANIGPSLPRPLLDRLFTAIANRLDHKLSPNSLGWCASAIVDWIQKRNDVTNDKRHDTKITHGVAPKERARSRAPRHPGLAARTRVERDPFSRKPITEG